MKTNWTQKNGFSLIEILVAAGLLAMLALGIASMFSQQQKEMKALDEKFVLQSLRQNILNILQSQATCAANLGAVSADISDALPNVPSANSFVFDEFHIGTATTTPLIVKKAVPLPGKPAGEMVPSSIALKNIYQTGNANEYRGTLVINFTPSTMTRVLKPLEFDQIFTITPPASSAFISNCGPKGAALTVSCMDISNTCATSPTSVGNCASPATIPSGYKLTGGSCISINETGAGRLLFASAPNSSGTQWICADRDAGGDSTPGNLTAVAHACISNSPGSDLDCLPPQATACATSPVAISNCSSPVAPAGYQLVGGGCNEVATPPVHFLLTSAPNAAGDRWVCQGRDVSSGTNGTMTAYGIFCRASTGSVNVLTCKTNSVTVPVLNGSMAFASASAAPGSAITAAGCSSTGFSTAGRFMTALQVNTPSTAVCLNKDHLVGVGGQTTATTVSCGF